VLHWRQPYMRPAGLDLPFLLIDELQNKQTYRDPSWWVGLGLAYARFPSALLGAELELVELAPATSVLK